MDDMLDLIVTPKKYEEIEFNFDQLKEEISVQLKRYTNMVVTEETIKLAKEDKAELNKLMKALDTRRKEVKKECMEPYEAFASKVKELTDLIAEPIKAIDSQLNEFENKRKAEKEAQIREAYENIVPDDIKEYLAFEKAIEPRWLNSTFKMKDIETSLSFKAERIKVDLAIVLNVDDDLKIPVKQHYMQELDITSTLAYIEELKRMRESINAYKEEVRVSDEEAKVVLNTSAPVTEEPIFDYTFKFTCTRSQAIALRNYLESQGIRYEMI